jgi:uncharacterized membrane protein
MPNCSHSSLTVKRALCANITKRIIASIGVTFFQDIRSGSVTDHSGSFVTYHSGLYLLTGASSREKVQEAFQGVKMELFSSNLSDAQEAELREAFGSEQEQPVGQS